MGKIKVDQIQTADGSGTIALQNQLSGMTSASMPTGSVLQVVQGTTDATSTSTTTTYTITDCNVAITTSIKSCCSSMVRQYIASKEDVGI